MGSINEVKERGGESPNDGRAGASVGHERVNAMGGMHRRDMLGILRDVGGIAIVGVGFVGTAAYLGYRAYRSDRKADQHNRALLDQFGNRGRVIQMLGRSTYERPTSSSVGCTVSAMKCVVQNDRGQKIVVWFSGNLPVVEGEEWEISYDERDNVLFLVRQVLDSRDLHHP